MNCNRLIQTADSWRDLTSAVWDRRYYNLTTGPSNICAPGNANAFQYMPFDKGGYIWRDCLKFNAPVWSDIQRTRPEVIIHGNPLEPSIQREGKYRIWDAAAGIPVAHIRGDRIHKPSEVRGVSNINTQWLNSILPAIQRIGPLGFDHRIVRPTGPFILDLTKAQYGWEMLELAHMLAHIRDPDSPHYHKPWGHTCGTFYEILAEVVTAVLFNLPIDVSDRSGPRMADLCYGIDVKATTDFVTPLLTVPWDTRRAPVPDETLIVVQAGIHVEPHPISYERHTDNFDDGDNWCCLPSMVSINGWTGVDQLLHQPLVRHHYSDQPNYNAPIMYGIHVNDLDSTCLLWAYLTEAYDRYGAPPTDETHRYFMEYIDSDDYGKLRDSTPPMVCKTCLSFKRSNDAPRHPHPDYKEWKDSSDCELKQRYEDNLVYVKNVDRVHGILDKAITHYEIRRADTRSSAYRKSKKTRLSNYRKHLRALKEHKIFMRLHRKKMWEGYVPLGTDNPIGPLTDNELGRYMRFIEKHTDDLVDKLINKVVDMGHPPRMWHREM